MSDRVTRFGPPLYGSNATMQAVYVAQQHELDRVGDEQRRAFVNRFVTRCNADGMGKWERVVSVLPDPTDELEFRRQRVINRLSTKTPFTEIWLRRWLTDRFGEGHFFLEIDWVACEASIDIDTTVPGLYEDTMQFMREIIPAHIDISDTLSVPYTWAYMQNHYTWSEAGTHTWGYYEDNSEVIT